MTAIYKLDSQIERVCKHLYARIHSAIRVNPFLNPRKSRLFITILVIGGLIAFFIYYLSKPVVAAWFDENWAYRKAISLTNSGSTQTDYQMAISFDTATAITAGKMKSDCSDIRVTDQSGKLLPFWVEEGDSTSTTKCNTATTNLWVKIPNIYAGTSATTLYIYYGNSQATSLSNGGKTFEFFEDFDSNTLNASKWITSGSPTASSGALSLSNSAALRSVNTVSANDGTRQMVFRAKTGSTSLTTARLGYSDNSTLSTSYTNADSAAVLIGNEQAYFSTVASSNEPGLWTFSDLTGDLSNGNSVTDSSGNSNSLTSVQGATRTTGKYDYGITLNGTTQYLTQTAIINQTTGTGITTTSTQITDTGTNFATACSSGSCAGTSTNRPYMLVAVRPGKKLHFAQHSSSGTWTVGNYVVQGTSCSSPSVYATIRSDRSLDANNEGRPGLEVSNIQGTFTTGSAVKDCVDLSGTAGTGTATIAGYASALGNWLGWGYIGEVSGGSNQTVTLYKNKTGTSTQQWNGDGQPTSGLDSNDIIYQVRKSDFQITNQALTIGAWVKRGTTGSAEQVISKWSGGWEDNYALRFESADTLKFWLQGTGAATTTATYTSTTSWYYVVATYDGTYSKIYVNGSLAATGTSTTGNLQDSYTALRVGSYDVFCCTAGFTNVVNYFNGSVDSPFVLNQTLSADQILALYNRGTPKYGLTTTHSGGANSTFADSTSTATMDTNYHNFKITQKASSADFDVDGVTATASTNSPTTSQYIRLENSDSSASINVDWVFLRKSSSTEPTVASTASEETGNGPVGYWKFDDGQGTVAKDSSSSGNNGTLSGTTKPTWQTEDQCVSGKCLYFDGSTSYVQKTSPSNLPTGSSSRTISAWVKSAKNLSTNTESAILWYGTPNVNNEVFGLITSGNSPGKLYFWGWNNDQAGSTTLAVNQWYHVAVTYDGSAIKLYVNGKLDGTKNNVTLNTVIDADGLIIGKRTDYTSQWQGQIDEPKIYPYARSSAQILADFNSRSSRIGSSAQIGSSSNQWLSQGLVGYWKMDETTSPAVDSSGNGNSGTWNGNTAAAAGKFGNAVSLDGTSDYLSVPDSSVWDIGTGDFAIAGWFNATSFDGTHRYVFDMAKGADGTSRVYFAIRNSNACHVAFGISSDAICDAPDPSTGTWHHFVAKRASGTMYLYIDGVLAGTPLADTTNINAVDTIRIGDRYSDDAASSWNGKLDEIRVYNRALTSAEIQNLYNWAPGPVAYWNMEEGTGTAVNDTSGHSYNGTLTAGTWATGKYGKGIYFNGASDTVTTVEGGGTFDLSTTDVKTISAWVKYTGPTTIHNVFFSKLGNFTSDSGYALSIWNNKMSLAGDDNEGRIDYSGTTILSTNTWYYLTYVISKPDNTAKFYINGVLEATKDISNRPGSWNNTYTVYLGSRNNSGYWFKGWLDDVRVYNYARTQKQIVSDMNGGHPSVGSPIGSPLGYWKFDEGYGTTANNSGNGGSALNGTLTNMASPATSTSGWTQAGKYGKALNFDGSNDMVDMGAPTALSFERTDSFSLSAWVKTTATAGQIIGKENSGNRGYALAVSSSKPVLSVANSTTNGITISSNGANINDGQWHHVVGTYDGSSSASGAKLYVDGKDVSTTTADTLSDTITSSSNVRAGQGNYWGYLADSIDEVKIYNYALTADEVKLDYNRGSSMVLGAMSDAANGGNSASAEYCIPGDTSTCSPPVGEWNFEEGNGSTVNDTSGNSNTGTWNGTGTHWVPGKVGKAGKFNGSDDYTDLPNVGLTNINAVTTEAWVKPNSPSSAGSIFLFGVNTIELQISTARKVVCRIRVISGDTLATATSTNAIPDQQWSHIGCVYNNSTVQSYINGFADGTPANQTGNTRVGNNEDTTVGYEIGRGVSWPSLAGTSYFKGQIDQLRVYKYARTAAQIAWDYNKGAPVGWWKFDECQGTTAHDSSGNSNNGTITIGSSGTQTSAGTCTTSGTAWGNGATGKRNASLNFDGSDDYVDVGNGSSLKFERTNPFTIQAWAKTANTSDNDFTLYEKGDFPGAVQSYGMALRPGSGVIDIWLQGTNNSSRIYWRGPVGVTMTNWNQYTFTYDGSSSISGLKVYVNGKQISSSYTENSLDSSIQNNNNATIGTGFTSYANGQIDDVRVYNYALTATQVQNLYNGGSAVRFGPQTGSP